MPATILDTLVVNLAFRSDRRGIDEFERRISNVRHGLDRLSQRFMIVGAVGAAGLGFVGKAGLDTEESLLRTRAALALTEDEMRQLRDEALRVGSTLPLNTKDIVDAQLAYGKLGATFQEILRDVPAIAGAAVATGLQPEQVAQYARIVQNVFGGDVQENLDMLLRTANRSPSTFAALGESIQFSGQAAVDAGMDFRTYLATLGSTAGAGRSVESVSQGMAAMFGRLAKATENTGVGGKRLVNVFEDVGINFQDVQVAMDGTSEGFINVLRLMNEANMSTTQLTALLSTLAGDTYAASISYAVQNPEMLDALLAEIDASAGEVAKQQEIILSGASGGIKEMMAMIDTLLNRMSEVGVLGGIQRFTTIISGWIELLTKTDAKGELVNARLIEMITQGVTLLAGFLALSVVLRVLSFLLGSFTVLMRIANGLTWLWNNAIRLAATRTWGFIVGLKALRIVQLAGAAATKIATIATLGFSAALLTNPITWIILGIVALGAALVALVVHWETVKKAVMDFWDRWGGWISGALAVIMPFIGIPLLIARNWDKLRQFFTDLWDWIIANIRAAVDTVSNIIRPITSALGAIGSLFGGGSVSLNASPAGQLATEFAGGLAQGPALQPVGPPAAEINQYSSVANRTNSVGKIEMSTGPITINSQSGDPEEIARQVRDAIGDEWRSVAHDFDSSLRE